MPKNFVPGALQTNSPVQAPMDMGTQGQTAAAAGGMLEDTANILKDIFDKRVLTNVAQAGAEVMNDTSGYERTRDTLMEGLLSTTDREEYARIDRELRRLRNGEVQGILSPRAAAARMSQVARTYINRSPKLAGEIRTLLKAVQGDVDIGGASGSFAAEDDPIAAARYEIIKEAEKAGELPAVWLENQRTKDEAVAAENLLKRKLALGTLRENDFREAHLSRILASNVDLWRGMEKAVRAGGFIKEEWGTALRQGKEAALQSLTNRMTEFEIGTGVKFSLELRNEFRKNIENMFDTMAQFAEMADTPTKQLRLIETHNDTVYQLGVKAWQETMGPYMTLLSKSPEAIVQVWPKIMKARDNIQHGLGGFQEKIAEMDVETRSYIMLMKGGDQEIQHAINERAAAIMNGDPNPPSTGNAFGDTLADLMTFPMAEDSKVPEQDKKNTVLSHASQGKIDYFLKRPAMLAQLKKDEASQKAIENSIRQQVNSLAGVISDQEKSRIFINPKATTGPFNTPPSLKVLEQMEKAPKGATRPTELARDAASSNLTTYLNRVHELFIKYKTPQEVQEWMNEVFSSSIQVELPEEEGKEGKEGKSGDTAK